MATYQPLSTLPNLYQNTSTANSSPMGVTATNPSFNLTAPKTTLSPSQTSAYSTPATSSYSSPAYSSSGTPNYSTSTSAPKTTTTTVPAVTPITNIDNVNHTYMQGTQKYALNPTTGRFEAVSSTPSTQPQNPSTYTPPQTTASPSNSGTGVSNAYTAPGATPLTGLTGIAPQAQPQDTTYSGLLQQLVQRSQVSPEELALNQRLAELKAQQANAVGQEQMMPETNAYQTGRVGIINQIGQAQQQNLAEQSQNLAAQRGVATTALGTAAGLAKPELATYSQQAFNPQTGQFSGGQSINDAVQGVVQKLQSGQMTYDQATQALSGYGQGGINALQQALPQGFNQAQSSTLAAQQGSIKPAYDFAKTAITNLQSTIQKLGIAQGTNVPIINAIGNTFSGVTGVGSDSVRQYQGAVAEARNAYAQLLAASKGGTPSDYGAQATAAIPDNATPNDVQAALNNLESLGGSKVNIYGNPGMSGTGTSSSTANSTSLYSW